MRFNQQFVSFLSKVRAVALDLDGVVYQGRQLLPGVREAIQEIRQLGLGLYFVTNNSGKARADIISKLSHMGIQTAESEVLTSGYAASVLVRRLSRHDPAKVLVIGSDSLKAEMAQSGARVVESGPCEFVVVGLDVEFSYGKISTALEALLGGAVFIACNRDATFPVEGGRILPGCGAMVAAIESACGRRPDYEVGKPQVMLLEMLADGMRLRPYEIVVVGDRPESDIAMANRFGSLSVLVLPIAKRDQQTRLEVPAQGSCLVVRSLVELPNLLRVAQLKVLAIEEPETATARGEAGADRNSRTSLAVERGAQSLKDTKHLEPSACKPTSSAERCIKGE